MENRDRDKVSGDMNKDDSESSFGKSIGRSEGWDSEPSRKDESDSSWKGDSGRSSNLGEQSEDVSSPRSGGSSTEH